MRRRIGLKTHELRLIEANLSYSSRCHLGSHRLVVGWGGAIELGERSHVI